MGYDSGLLIYKSIYGDMNLDGMYEKVVMFVSVEDSHTYDVHFRDDGVDSNRAWLHSFIVFVLLNILSLILTEGIQ